MKAKKKQALILCLLSSVFISFFVYEEIVSFIFTILINFYALVILYFGNRFISNVSIKRFSKHIHGFKHLLILIPLSVLLSILVILSHQFMLHVIINKSNNLNLDLILLLSLAISFFIVTTFEGVDFFNHWKGYIIRAEKIEKTNLLAKYEMLKKQLNTHFLFNSLSTLISFIETNNKIAAEYAQNLSDFLTFLLSYQKTDLITLREELSIVNQYIFLQRPRFNNNLETEIFIEEKYLNTFVPPLALQMMVENALKHNIISFGNKLTINIYYENQYIFVKNNLHLKNNVNSTKTGIENIKGRYQLFTEKSIIINKEEDFFLIGVPILNNASYENCNY